MAANNSDMAETRSRRGKLTQEDLRAAANLRAIWAEKAKFLGLTQALAGERMGGIGQSAVSQYMRGLIPLGTRATIQFAAILEVEPWEIRPEMRSLIPAKQQNTQVSDEISIPQYNTGGIGGNGGLVLRDQPGVIQQWTVSHEWVRANIPSCTSPKNLCLVTGFGDSMPDTFSPGDPVIIDRGVTTCDHDGIYFFRVGNEGFIKILQRIPGVGIKVISQNKNYESWTLTQDMDFEVFGKVLKAWKGKNY